MSSQPSWGVHWFRRDLRLTANPAFQWSCKKHGGRVLGIFSFDPIFLARPDFSVNRFAFFLESLHALREQLRTAGGDLLVLDLGPDSSFRTLLQALKKSGNGLPQSWSWNRDYEPFAIARDTRIHSLIECEFGVPVHTSRDHLLIEPSELYKGEDQGTFYQVFTPFKKKWLSLLATEEIQDRLPAHVAQGPQKSAKKCASELALRWSEVLPKELSTQFSDSLETYRKRIGKQITVKLPPAGERAAWQKLKYFQEQALDSYPTDRDIPSVEGTSQLSIYLKNGSITVPQILAELGLNSGVLTARHFKYRDELIWREFYYHILAHVPRVESGPFRLKYQDLAWEDHPSHLEAWKKGMTGFPIVDAGLRQLNATGWMHNRVRMIVASFLTKDLLCNWQHGERYFMEKLLDGDLAPNNGGWQWAASTGCDPQPYFRVFNPTLQSKRFDPQGKYLRHWIPELRGLSNSDIHEPWRTGDPGTGYPRPIVDHAVQSRKAIALYRGAPKT